MKNKSKEKFSMRKRIKSFGYAFNGLKILILEEHNARIHLVVLLLVIIAGALLQISSSEWLIIALCAGAVFASEAFNSALENLCDLVSPEWNEKIKKVKDLAAGAVFISAIASIICGLLIFLPKLNSLLIE